MLKDIPDHIWVLLSAVIVVAVVLAVVVILRMLQGRVRIKTKWGEISGPDDDHEAGRRVTLITPANMADLDPVVGARLQCMLDRLPLIRQDKWSAFLSAIRAKNVPAVDLIALDDAQYYQQCLGNIIWSGNGIRSFKTIIEKALIDGVFLEHSEAEFDVFLDDVMARLRENESRYLDNAYRSKVMTVDGYERTRIIDRDELYKLNEARRSDIREIVRAIFVNAKQAGCA